MHTVPGFSKRLHDVRRDRGLTQLALSKRTKIHQTLISHYESGDRVPSVYNLQRLCIGLNVNADWLLGIADDVLTVPRSKMLPSDRDVVKYLIKRLSREMGQKEDT